MADATKTLSVDLLTNVPVFQAQMAAAAAAVKSFQAETTAAGAAMTGSMGAAVKEMETLTVASRAAAVAQKEVAVAATGLAGGFKTAAAEAANLARPFTAFSAAGREGADVLTRVGTSASGVGAGLAGVGGAAGVAAAGLAVLGAEGVKSFLKLADDARTLQNRMGGTAQEASGLAAVMRHFGIDIDAGATSMQRMATNIGKHQELLQSWGIEIARTSSGNVDMAGTLENLAQRWTEIQDPTEKARLGAQLFGRQWATLVPILNQGRDGIKALYDEAGKHGEILSQKDIDQAKQFEISMRDLKLRVEALAASFGRELIPVLIRLAGVAEEVLGPIDRLTRAAGGIGGIIAHVGLALAGPLGLGLDAASHIGGKDPSQATKDIKDHAAAQEDDAKAGQTDADNQNLYIDAILKGGSAAVGAQSDLVALLRTEQQRNDVLAIARDAVDGNKRAMKEAADTAKDHAEILKVQSEETKKLSDLHDQETQRLQNLARADQEVAKAQEGLATAQRKLSDLRSFGLAEEDERLHIAAARAAMDETRAVQGLADAQQKLSDLQSFGLEQEHERNVKALTSAREEEAKAIRDQADAQEHLNDLLSFGLAEQAERDTIADARAHENLAAALQAQSDAQRDLNKLINEGLADQRQKAQDQAVRAARDLVTAERNLVTAQRELNDVTRVYAESLERADIASERASLRKLDAQDKLTELQKHLADLEDPNTSIALTDAERQKEILQTQRDIASAKLDIRDAALTETDAEKALSDERSQGLQNATTAAEDKLAAARQKVNDATIANRDAQRSLNDEIANEGRQVEDAQNKVTTAQLSVREAILSTTDADRTLAREGESGARLVRDAKDQLTEAQKRQKEATDAEADANRTLSREAQTQAQEMSAANMAVQSAALQLRTATDQNRTAQRDLNTEWDAGGRLSEMLRQGTDNVTQAQDTLGQKIDAVTKLEQERGRIDQEVTQLQEDSANRINAIYDRINQRQQDSIDTLKRNLADVQAAYQAAMTGFSTSGTANSTSGAAAVAQDLNPVGPSTQGPAVGSGGQAGLQEAIYPGSTTSNPYAWHTTDSRAYHAAGGDIGAGFVTNKPMAIVGEGDPRYPEYVIATDPQYGPRNVELMKQANKHIGAFAAGGSFEDAQNSLPKPMPHMPGDTDLFNNTVEVMEAALWKAAADGLRVKYNAMQAANAASAAAPSGASPGADAAPFSSPGGSGPPDDQIAAAKLYGGQNGFDYLILLAIAAQETDFGRLGDGRRGNILGYGSFDSGSTYKYAGVDAQYSGAAGLLARDGVHTIEDIIAGKAANYATDPGWESGVASHYRQLKAAGYEMGGLLNVGVMDQGGFLMPGWNLNFNGTGSPERVSGPGSSSSVTNHITLSFDHLGAGVNREEMRQIADEVVVPRVVEALNHATRFVNARA